MKMSGAEEAAAAAPAGGVARACAWSGAGGGGGGAGGGAAAAVDVVDDDAGRFATAARARSHHLLRCLRTLTAAQILRARCFSRSLCSLLSPGQTLRHWCQLTLGHFRHLRH